MGWRRRSIAYALGARSPLANGTATRSASAFVKFGMTFVSIFPLRSPDRLQCHHEREKFPTRS